MNIQSMYIKYQEQFQKNGFFCDILKTLQITSIEHRHIFASGISTPVRFPDKRILERTLRVHMQAYLTALGVPWWCPLRMISLWE